MKLKKVRLSIFSFCLLSLTWITIALANLPDCILCGRVVDASGQPLLGVLVEIKGEKQYVGLTDREGVFRLEGVEPGNYELKARVLGFMSAAVQQFTLEPAQELKLEVVLKDLPLEVAAQQQAVDLSWLLRGGKRDILWSQPLLLVDDAVVEASAYPLRGRITAEMELRDEIEARQALVQLSPAEQDDWQFQAGFRQLEGMSLAAFGSWQQRISPSHLLQLDFDYRDYFFSQDYTEGSKGWMASVQAANSWRIASPWLLSWSLNYRHYNALEGGHYLSPKVELTWSPQQDLALRGAVSYRVRGPEAAAYQELLGFLLQEGSLQPERCLSYEIGIEHLSEDNYLVSLTAYHDQVQHYLISLYLPEEHRALSSNVGDAIVEGIQLALTKSFLQSCQASLSYRWQQATGDELQQAGKMLQEIEGGQEALGFELSHEISTALEALIKPTDTTVEAIYRLNMAPLEEGNSLNTGEMGFSSRLDVKVRQLLPQVAGAYRWEVYLWMKNLLNQQQLNFFNLREDELLGLPRVFVSGLIITF